MMPLKKHISILLGLIGISIFLFFTKGKQTQNDFDKNIFQISDTTDVQEIIIKKNNASIKVVRNETAWALNDSLKADPSLIRIFNAIMSQVQIVRPVSPLNFEEVKSDIIKSGQKITLIRSGQEFAFFSGGNSSKTQAYFADETLENIYLVRIPGYNNYLSGLFELTLNQWRDRILFASSWRTIQLLQIDYTDNEKVDLDIRFDGQFMKVKNINSLDTTNLMNYMGQFENFQVNDYLNPNEYPQFDSLKKTRPMATLNLTDIDKTKNRQVDIYNKIPNQRFYLFTDANNQMIVIDEGRVNNLMKSPNHFQAK